MIFVSATWRSTPDGKGEEKTEPAGSLKNRDSPKHKKVQLCFLRQPEVNVRVQVGAKDILYRDIWSFRIPFAPSSPLESEIQVLLRFLSRNSCHALSESFVARPARGEKWNPSRGIRRRRRRRSVDKTVAGAENQDHFSILLLRSIHGGRQFIIMQGIWKKEEQFYQICRNLRENNPFFQEWNKLLKKSAPPNWIP